MTLRGCQCITRQYQKVVVEVGVREREEEGEGKGERVMVVKG